ncbi:hypothetical protein B0H13DRAFT_2358201 [Mycena leptocephala]|nr:hypothetical protein B0H13DRAFT_2358201 [Mycena leptocephala]
MSKRTRSQYIDDSAEVDHDPLMREDGSDDDDDSTRRSCVARTGRTSTWKSSTLVTKKDCALMRHTGSRLRCCNTARRLLLAATLRLQHSFTSTEPSPAWTAPSQAVSRASTPLYSRPKMICLGTRRPRYSSPSATRRPLFARLARSTPYAFNLRGETPTFFPTLVGPIPRRQETPLFEGLRLPPPQRDLTPVSPVTSPAPSRPTSPEPPAKKRRARLHRFLDVSAEDSDEEEEEEEEDEETLSDKVHDDPQRAAPCSLRKTKLKMIFVRWRLLRPVPASTTSAPPAVVEDTILPDTWVIPKYGLHKGLLALVLTKRKFLAASVHIHSFVVHGPHQGETGFIVVLREVPVSGQRVKYAKILKDYNGVDILKKEDAGLYVQVAHLERHGLDIPCAIVVQDRVRVVSGVLYRGITGRVIDNSQGFLTVAASSNSEIVGATTTSEISDRQVFQISIRYVNRDFRCGDLGDKPKPEQTEFPDHVFKVRAADVDFATYDERESGLTIEHAGISSYTPTSHVAALKPPIRDEDAEQRLRPKSKAPNAASPTCVASLVGLKPKPSARRRKTGIPSDAGSVDKVSTKNHEHRSPLRRHAVLVAGKGMHKGFQGTVIGDHDNAARDQDGIVITIRSDTAIRRWSHCGQMPPPIHLLAAHEGPFLASRRTYGPRRPAPKGPIFKGLFRRRKLHLQRPPLPGEDDGGWMCIPGLSGKRFDVQVVGITGVKERTSPTLLALEGRHGHILANAPIQRGTKKLDVCGVGKSGTKHAVYAQCIKPRRKDDDGRSLTEISQRVVVIGPDMGEGTSFEGCYGLTQPEVPHFYDSGVVCVKVELPVEKTFETAFFAATSLCMAKNVALNYGGQVFPATTFPE